MEPRPWLRPFPPAFLPNESHRPSSPCNGNTVFFFDFEEILTTPISLPSGPSHWLFQRPHAESKFLAASKIDEHIEAGEFTAQLAGWSCERRFVVIRERVREGRVTVGRKLLDVPSYTYRVSVTNRAEAPEVIWRDCNQRATLEQRIDELKGDLGAEDFYRREFYATEAAFRSVLLLFNLLSLWQTAAHPTQTYRRPATLRTEVFLCGAIAAQMDALPCST